MAVVLRMVISVWVVRKRRVHRRRHMVMIIALPPSWMHRYGRRDVRRSRRRHMRIHCAGWSSGLCSWPCWSPRVPAAKVQRESVVLRSVSKGPKGFRRNTSSGLGYVGGCQEVVEDGSEGSKTVDRTTRMGIDGQRLTGRQNSNVTPHKCIGTALVHMAGHSTYCCEKE